MLADLKSYRVLGFKITPVTNDGVVEVVADSIGEDAKIVVASLNVHGMYVYLTDNDFAALHEQDRTHVHIDGTPLIWLARWARLPVQKKHRTAVIDWIMPLMRRAADAGWRVYYLGSPPDVCDEGLRRIGAEVPNLQLAGRNGYFDATPGSAENKKVVDDINAFGADIVIVGMGMGRQERWILQNADALDTHCIATTGACMELIAGALPRAPAWTGPAGVEWLFRLLTAPHRVGRRYLIEPWLIAWMLLRNRLRPGATRRG